jgi:hypothetical protein
MEQASQRHPQRQRRCLFEPKVLHRHGDGDRQKSSSSQIEKTVQQKRTRKAIIFQHSATVLSHCRRGRWLGGHRVVLRTAKPEAQHTIRRRLPSQHLRDCKNMEQASQQHHQRQPVYLFEQRTPRRRSDDYRPNSSFWLCSECNIETFQGITR